MSIQSLCSFLNQVVYLFLMLSCLWKSLSCVWFFETPWTMQRMEFSRPEWVEWVAFLFSSDLPNPGIEPRSPMLQADSLPTEPKKTWVGSLSLLQHIFLTQELNQGLLQYKRILFFFFLFVVDFVIHWNETAMGLHVFPIPIPPPTSLSTHSL